MLFPPVNLIQKRIANISIGASALRGQPSGTIEIARKFLINLDLNIFKSIKDEVEFRRKLDEQTSLLKEKIPSRSWGISRKALNLFLFHSVHDVFLSKEYALENLIPFLELTLDNPNAKKLIEQSKIRRVNLDWKNIKSLTKEQSNKLQDFAKSLAKEEYNCERCYLDVYFWRAEKG